MLTVRNLTIKQKLLVITMVTVGASLLLAGTGIVISDSILFRNGMQRDLKALANIVGDASMAALDFDDPRVATEILTPLKARPHIIVACTFKEDGTPFASYTRSGSNEGCSPPAVQEDIRFTSSELIASHPVLRDGRRVGTLVIHYDLGEAAERTKLDIEIVLAILLSSSLIAFLLSSRLREIIAAPISRLADAAVSVSNTGDYSVRVEKDSRDELGVLVDAFNRMLARIQSRDLEVQNARYSLQTTLTSIGDAVISTDIRGFIVFANPAARILLHLPEQELEGRPIDEVFRIINEYSREEMENPVFRVLREGSIIGPTNHTVLISSDGTEYPIDNTAAPIRDAHEVLMGIVLIFRDISSRRSTEKMLETQAVELRQKALLLKEADERKDQFLAMLAHELRNPLAPIRNAVQVLKLIGPANANQQWAGEVIERQTQHLTRLVDDLLDVSRITRGKVTLQYELVEISTIIDRAVEMNRPLINARKQQLTVLLPPEPLYVKGDLTRLVQAVGNILNNAAKFTDDGGTIGLVAEQIGKEAVIRVKDNGIGLSASLMPQIFDLFTQAERSLDRSQGGLGIGLTIVRNLVELHGGSVEARSEGFGRGSEFIVRLPVFATPAEAAVSSEDGTGHTSGCLRILILEDNVDSAEMLQFLLKLDRHDVRIAFDGGMALEAAQEFQPQVVLCDIGLPGMNGYEVAMHLRTQPEFRQTRLIALSGYGQEEDFRRSKDAGFDYHLTKPVEPEVLTALLGSMFTAKRTGT